MQTRRLFVLGVCTAAMTGATQARPCKVPRILFVCPAGTVKSAIAREMLKRQALTEGVRVAVQSRGVELQDHVSPALAARLDADGINTKAEPLRKFSRSDTRSADYVIAFDEAADTPGLEAAMRWDVPSWNDQYDDAKSQTSGKIKALLAEIRARTC